MSAIDTVPFQSQLLPLCAKDAKLRDRIRQTRVSSDLSDEGKKGALLSLLAELDELDKQIATVGEQEMKALRAVVVKAKEAVTTAAEVGTVSSTRSIDQSSDSRGLLSGANWLVMRSSDRPHASKNHWKILANVVRTVTQFKHAPRRAVAYRSDPRVGTIQDEISMIRAELYNLRQLKSLSPAQAANQTSLQTRLKSLHGDMEALFRSSSGPSSSPSS